MPIFILFVAAMFIYCGNLLWQSDLTLFALNVRTASGGRSARNTTTSLADTLDDTTLPPVGTLNKSAPCTAETKPTTTANVHHKRGTFI